MVERRDSRRLAASASKASEQFATRDLQSLLDADSQGHQYRYWPQCRIPDETHTWCFNLVRDNMQELYERCDTWDSDAKLGEMREAEQRFIVAYDNGRPVAFVMFQFTLEDAADDGVEIDVVYCYEMQVARSHQGRGIGRRLMRLMETLGGKWGMHKAMLTVFKDNRQAMGFYEKLGYTIDEISPSQWTDEDGQALDSESYEILSRAL